MPGASLEAGRRVVTKESRCLASEGETPARGVGLQWHLRAAKYTPDQSRFLPSPSIIN